MFVLYIKLWPSCYLASELVSGAVNTLRTINQIQMIKALVVGNDVINLARVFFSVLLASRWHSNQRLVALRDERSRTV